jgi:hypothetical protein
MFLKHPLIFRNFSCVSALEESVSRSRRQKMTGDPHEPSFMGISGHKSWVWNGGGGGERQGHKYGKKRRSEKLGIQGNTLRDGNASFRYGKDIWMLGMPNCLDLLGDNSEINLVLRTPWEEFGDWYSRKKGHISCIEAKCF